MVVANGAGGGCGGRPIDPGFCRGEATGATASECLLNAAHRSGAAGLIEVELGDRFGVGRIEGGRLVEVVGGERVHRSDVTGVEFEGGPRAGERRGGVLGSSR